MPENCSGDFFDSHCILSWYTNNRQTDEWLNDLTQRNCALQSITR